MRSLLTTVTHRRGVVVAGIVSVLVTFFPSLAQGAGPIVKASRVGQKIVWRGYVYTVISSKGKLIWKQGAKVPVAPSSTPTPSASTTPSSTPTASATSSPSASASPTQSTSPITPPFRPDLGVFIANAKDIKEGSFGVFAAKNSKNQTLNYALSRKNNQLKCFSTICTHAGCVVQASRDDLWCPCHSSNFDAFTGVATGGPAKDALSQYAVTEFEGFVYVKI
jgi:Rieske Fe-S protein